MGGTIARATAFLLLLHALASVSAFGETAAQIVRYGEQRLRGQSSQAIMTMVVRRAEFTRTLKLRSWATGTERALVEILAPAKEEGISSLRVGEQMWNYLPNSEQVVRVPTSLMLQSWMGSDFTNDDLMKSSSLSRDYVHRIVRRQTVAGEKLIVIECLPKTGAPVVWGKIRYWARVRDRLPAKEEYFDEHGKLVRTVTLRRYRRMDDRIVPTEIIVRRAEAPRETTVVRYQKLLYDRTIDPGVFRRDNLKTTSQQGKVVAQEWRSWP